MKLTKGKIFKLLNKKKQTKKPYKSKNKIIKNKKTFRTKRKVNLSNTSLKNNLYNSSKDDNEIKEINHSENNENNENTEISNNNNFHIEDTIFDSPENDNTNIEEPLELLENKHETIDDNIETNESIGTSDDQDYLLPPVISDDNGEKKIHDTPIEIEFEDLDVENNKEKDTSIESIKFIYTTENDTNIETNTTIEPKIETISPSEKLFQNEDSQDILSPKKSKKRFRLTKKSRIDKIM